MINSIMPRIKADMIASMKAKTTFITNTLRSIISEVNKKVLDSNAIINDDLTKAVLIKAIKQREESIVAYNKGNRFDLVQIELTEKQILEKYLPAFLSQEDTIIQITKLKQTGQYKTFGDYMKVVKNIPNINMAIVQPIIKDILSKG